MGNHLAAGPNTPSRSLRRMLLSLLAAALLAAGGGISGAVWASHQFTDVGNGNFFHQSIGSIASAGCASGFNDGTFRPNSQPSRGQFAYWMSNCGTRAEEATGFHNPLSSTLTDSATASITAGAIENPAISTGGYVFADVAIDTSLPFGGASAGCLIYADLIVNDAYVPEILRIEIPEGDLRSNGSMNEVEPVLGGDTLTYKVRVRQEGDCGAQDPAVEVDLVAMYIPFDGTGQGGGL